MKQTYVTGPPRADLIKADFDTLIHQKGGDVIIETALVCPCKSEKTNQQGNCKNCGGNGWIFINPTQSRMVVSAIDVVTQFRPWSEELVGTVNITAFKEDRLAEMDRVTILNGESIHNEVLFFKETEEEDVIFTYSTYNIKQILYIGLFKGISLPLQRLVEGIDYTIERNIIKILKTDGFPFPDIENNNITVRYIHAPQFHIVQMKRDTMETYVWNSGEKLQHMPISAIGRRAHFQLGAQNLRGDRLIDNSYTEDKCQ